MTILIRANIYFDTIYLEYTLITYCLTSKQHIALLNTAQWFRSVKRRFVIKKALGKQLTTKAMHSRVVKPRNILKCI